MAPLVSSLLLGLLVAPGPELSTSTAEAPHGVHGEERIGCPLHWHNLVGFKLIGVAAFPDANPSEVSPQYGFGFLYERTFVPGWLELEVSANALFLHAEEAAHLPLDVLLKKPFHLSHVFDPYVGLGGAVVFGVGEESFVAPGAIASLGSYAWLQERVGVLLEVDYAAVYEPHGWNHELEFSTGATFRF